MEGQPLNKIQIFVQAIMERELDEVSPNKFMILKEYVWFFLNNNWIKTLNFKEVEISERTTHEPTADDQIKRKSKKDIKNNGIRNEGYKNGVANKIEAALKDPQTLPGRSKS